MKRGELIVLQPALPECQLESCQVTMALVDFWCVTIELVCQHAPEQFSPVVYQPWQIQWRGMQATYFYGRVSEWQQLSILPTGYRYRVTLRPCCWWLTQRQHYRSVGLDNWLDVIRYVLPMPETEWRMNVFDTKTLAIPNLPILQHGEQDDVWLRQQLSDQGLGWCFDHSDAKTPWVISDMLNQLHTIIRLKKVVACQMVEQAVLEQGFVTGQGVESIVSAPYCIRYDATSDDQAQRWQRYWQQAQQVQKRTWQIKVNQLLWAGQRVEGFSEEKIGLVISSQTDINQGVVTTQAVIADAGLPYRISPLPQPVIGVLPGCHVLTQQATQQTQQTVVDQQGNYCINLPDDWQKVGQASLRAVPMVHAAHFQDHCINFPHIAGAQVVLAFAQDSAQHPFMLGAVNSTKAPRKTRRGSAHNWYWQDQHGSQLAFLHQAGKNSMVCQVPNYNGQGQVASWHLGDAFNNKQVDGITRVTEGKHRAQHDGQYHLRVGELSGAHYQLAVDKHQWQEAIMAQKYTRHLVTPGVVKKVTIHNASLMEYEQAKVIKWTFQKSYRQVLNAQYAQYRYRSQRFHQLFQGAVRRRYHVKQWIQISHGQHWRTTYQQTVQQIDRIIRHTMDYQKVNFTGEQAHITAKHVTIKAQQLRQESVTSQIKAQQLHQQFEHMQLGGCLVLQGKCHL